MLNINIDNSIRKRAKNICKEIKDNTIAGEAALNEFSDYAGHKSSEDVLYSIFKCVVQDALYLNGIK